MPSRNWFHSTAGSGLELGARTGGATGVAPLVTGSAADMPRRPTAANRRVMAARFTMRPPGGRVTTLVIVLCTIVVVNTTRSAIAVNHEPGSVEMTACAGLGVGHGEARPGSP